MRSGRLGSTNLHEVSVAFMASETPRQAMKVAEKYWQFSSNSVSIIMTSNGDNLLMCLQIPDDGFKR